MEGEGWESERVSERVGKREIERGLGIQVGIRVKEIGKSKNQMALFRFA